MNNSMQKTLKLISFIGKICTVVFAFFAVLFTTITPIANAYEGTVNGILGLETSKRVDLSDEDAVRNENYKTEYGSIKELRDATHDASKRAQAEGAVLLMNKNAALPIRPATDEVLSFYSVSSYDPIWGGTGSGMAHPVGTANYESVSFPRNEGPNTYKKAFTPLGFTINETVWNWYESNLSTYKRLDRVLNGSQTQAINDAPWSAISTDAKTAQADVAFFVLARIGGEDNDQMMLNYTENGVATDRSYLELTPNEVSVLEGLKDQKSKGTIGKIVLIINSSNQPYLNWLTNDTYDIDAALWVGGYGQDGMNGVAELIAGVKSPSGKLSMQFWDDHALNPVQANFGTFSFTGSNYGTMYENKEASGSTSGTDHYVAYQEGMYLGYRYAETRYEDVVLGTDNVGSFDYDAAVAYPFGYGSSYTTFSLSDFSVLKMPDQFHDLLRPRYFEGERGANAKLLDAEGNIAQNGTFRTNSTKTPYRVTVTVKNTGSATAKEVVQVYMQRPYTDYDKTHNIEKPSVELVGFAKTKELGPNESEEVEITIDEKYFAVFDAYGEGTYVVTPGDYYLTAAQNAHEAVNNILRHKDANDKAKYPKLDATKIDSLFGQGGNAALVAKFTDPVAKTAGKDVNSEKYAYSDVTGLQINELFAAVDPNRDPLARGSNNPTDNMIDYISRSDWAGTVKLVNPDLTAAQQTGQVKLLRTTAWTELQSSMRNSSHVPKSAATDDNPMPTMGEDHGITLAMMAPVLDEDGNKVQLYDYDDPMWDKFLDQLTKDDYWLLMRDGFRSTRESDTVGKPRTVEHNGPVGFIYHYKTENGLNLGGNGKMAKDVIPYAEMGVTKQADGTYLPNRFMTDEDGEQVSMYGVEPEMDPDAGMYGTAFPSNVLLAATYNRELIEEVGEMVGEDALWGGYSGIYGTGVNIIRSQHQGRVFEYFSEDGFLSGVIAGRWSRGVQSRGCYVYNKHFALNEQELSRESINTFVNEQTFREIYLRAFEIPMGGEVVLDANGRLIDEEYDAKCVMGAFNRVGVVWSSAHKEMNTDWLRGEAGLSGFTVTDWFNSNKAIMNIGYAILAGNTLPDGEGGGTSKTADHNPWRYLPGESNENVEMVWKMREGIHRIMYTVADSNAMGGFSQNTQIIKLDVWWKGALSAITITSWILFGLSVVAFVGAAATATVFKLKAKPE